MEKKLIGKLCPFRRQTETEKTVYPNGYEKSSKREFFMQCDPNCMYYHEIFINRNDLELARLTGEDLSKFQRVYSMACRRCETVIK